MTEKPVSPPRCAVLVGPYTSGKTTLLESMLFAAGATHRKGTIREGNTVGDSSPESRDHQMTVEPNFAHAEYLGDRWSFIDCPGSVELSQDSRNALMAADVAILVAEPELDRALTLGPIFRFLEDFQIPHMLFVNKMDKGHARAKDLLETLQAVSPKPLVLRQVPIRDGEEVTGFVDLVSERAYRYQEGQTSALIEMPDSVKDREGEARQEMLESLADFDDDMHEQQLEDKVPAPDEIYGQLAKDLQEDLIVPVFLGSAEHMHGVRRLLKALRHEAPESARTAERLGIPTPGGFAATVVKVLYQSHTGRLSIARIWDGKLDDGGTLGGERVSGIYRLMGSENQKVGAAETGDLVALGRIEGIKTGDLLGADGPVEGSGMLWPDVKTPVYAKAIVPRNRQDEVKLSTSLAKLIEEDPSLSVEHIEATHQMLLWGQGEIHLKLSVERLKSKYNVDVEMAPPLTAYMETLRKGGTQRARF